MDKLIELLQQIQELAGVGVDALKGAGGGGEHKPGGPPEHGGGPPREGAEPHGGPPESAQGEGKEPMAEKRDEGEQGGGRPPFGRH